MNLVELQIFKVEYVLDKILLKRLTFITFYCEAALIILYNKIAVNEQSRKKYLWT